VLECAVICDVSAIARPFDLWVQLYRFTRP